MSVARTIPVEPTQRKVPGRIQKFLSTPKGYVIRTLVPLMIIALLSSQDRPGLRNAGVAVVVGVLVDIVFGLLQKRKRIVLDGAVITGLIVALVLSSTAPWYVPAMTTAIAIVSKNVIQVKRKPVFNPAAFGLLVAIFLFSSEQSWWGGLSLLPAWCIVFLIVAGYMVTHRVNKFPQVFSFLGVYFALLLAMAALHLGQPSYTPGDALRVPFVNSALFLAFFMLTDPPTSPAKYADQVWFGVIAAVVSVIIFATMGGLAYLLVGLLAANVWKVWRTRTADKKGKHRFAA